MKLENQVVSLELVKKLKELGVKQESLFVWTTLALYAHIPGLSEGPVPCVMPVYQNENPNAIPAFTVAELGEMLPERARVNGMSDWWSARENARWKAQYRYTINTRQEANTEADARAKILIYLLEQGLVKVEDLAA